MTSTQFNRKQLFVRDAMPAEWMEHADELKEAAEMLWKNAAKSSHRLTAQGTSTGGIQVVDTTSFLPVIMRPYVLLAGFAIENLIKGALVANQPSLISIGKLEGTLESHKIVNLISKVPDIELTNEEIEVCRIFETAIPYWGRYPIPRHFNGVLPEIEFTEENRTTFLGVYSRLKKVLYCKIRDGWDSGVGPKSGKIRSVEMGDEIDMNTSLADMFEEE